MFFYSNSNFKRIEKLIFWAFGKIFVLVNVFFYLNSFLKSIEKLIFSAFGKILVCGSVFFYSSSNLKNIQKLIISPFGKILVCGSVFSIQVLIRKVLKIDNFSFWQDLGFGESFFYSNSNLKSIEKLIFSAFGKIFVLVTVFFYSNSN